MLPTRNQASCLRPSEGESRQMVRMPQPARLAMMGKIQGSRLGSRTRTAFSHARMPISQPMNGKAYPASTTVLGVWARIEAEMESAAV